jgi:hypothetical protein
MPLFVTALVVAQRRRSTVPVPVVVSAASVWSLLAGELAAAIRGVFGAGRR